MFLLVSGRHVGAHVGGHQPGGSIQISINLGKTFLLISSVRKIAVTWILVRVFANLSSFYFQILDLFDRTVFIFYFDLFWMAWHWKPAIVISNVPLSNKLVWFVFLPSSSGSISKLFDVGCQKVVVGSYRTLQHICSTFNIPLIWYRIVSWRQNKIYI